MENLTILLQAEGGNGGMFNLILIGGMFLVMYLFMVRPQMKKAKEAKKFREGLNKGDNIVTIGGIHGKILEINDTSVLISVDSGKMRVEKSAVSPNAMASEQEISTKS